jgi:hypothetical protein
MRKFSFIFCLSILCQPQTHLYYMPFEILTMEFTVFWDVMPCGVVEVYWHVIGTYCLHLQS